MRDTHLAGGSIVDGRRDLRQRLQRTRDDGLFTDIKLTSRVELRTAGAASRQGAGEKARRCRVLKWHVFRSASATQTERPDP